MSNILEYKGYHSKIEFDVESMVLHGKIEFIGDLVTFESESAAEIENEFHAAVDDYLEFCKEVGKEPDKEFKGTFCVRISPELHKKAATLAFSEEISLNQFVENAIKNAVKSSESKRREISVPIETNVTVKSKGNIISNNFENKFCVITEYGGNVGYAN